MGADVGVNGLVVPQTSETLTLVNRCGQADVRACGHLRGETKNTLKNMVFSRCFTVVPAQRNRFGVARLLGRQRSRRVVKGRKFFATNV
jgi:RNase P/RNase MRP subunit p29